ncbi:hypothetical protein QU661_02350 [Mogibacterium neglectum]|uniref:hypothetical protein n=1 Tax=Mogibacterium neglectum TaxID=114528 RepID=UPI00272C5FEE|nr:hypothetical protein [Mogibacterium neglectum]WLD76703.1 hypothetical protein QU661_02350 [Mogibacterium neglectum]
MVRRRRMTDAEKALLIEEGKVARRHKMLKTSMRIAGLSLLAGATLVVATKKIFDEIFVEDDWSDVDWGEEDEDYGVY